MVVYFYNSKLWLSLTFIFISMCFKELPNIVAKLSRSKSKKSDQEMESWEDDDVQNTVVFNYIIWMFFFGLCLSLYHFQIFQLKLNLSPKKVRQLKEKSKSSLLARTCLKFCFDPDVLSKSVVVGGNQQKDAEAPKLDSEKLDNICGKSMIYIIYDYLFIRTLLFIIQIL